MTDKQKIRAKIGKLKSEYNKESVFRTVRGDTAREVLDKLLSFIDSMPEEPVSKSLERAADSYASTFCENSRKVAYEAYKMGAKWKEKQLMEDALNCSIIMHPNDRFANYSISAYVPPLHPASTYISNGDKVKIIIIREEEK